VPARPRDEVVARPRPNRGWPRWWQVRRANDSTPRVIDDDILQVPLGPDQDLDEAVAAYRRSLRNTRIVNSIGANVIAPRLRQLDALLLQEVNEHS
jgi:hypothetical protein